MSSLVLNNCPLKIKVLSLGKLQLYHLHSLLLWNVVHIIPLKKELIFFLHFPETDCGIAKNLDPD